MKKWLSFEVGMKNSDETCILLDVVYTKMSDRSDLTLRKRTATIKQLCNLNLWEIL